MSKEDLPVLTDVFEQLKTQRRAAGEPLKLDETELAELQTQLATRSFELLEELVHSTVKRIEGTLYEEFINRLRIDLPDMIDEVLREHFERAGEEDDLE